jgi:hypothetical protein
MDESTMCGCAEGFVYAECLPDEGLPPAGERGSAVVRSSGFEPRAVQNRPRLSPHPRKMSDLGGTVADHGRSPPPHLLTGRIFRTDLRSQP